LYLKGLAIEEGCLRSAGHNPVVSGIVWGV